MEMSAAEKEIYEMATVGGLAPVAIAEQLELPVSSVYSALRKLGLQGKGRGIGNRQTGLTEEQRKALAERYKNGESIVSLCAEAGISRTAFMRILYDYEVPVKSNYPSRQDTAARDAIAVKMYVADATLSQICADTGITPSRLYIALRRAGIKLRREVSNE